MTWNYRVIRYGPNKDRPDAEECFGIHEVYYDDAGKPIAMTKDAVGVVSETIKGLQVSYEMLAEAFRRPVLDYDAIPQTEEETNG
jgi:hypothetical protein